MNGLRADQRHFFFVVVCCSGDCSPHSPPPCFPLAFKLQKSHFSFLSAMPLLFGAASAVVAFFVVAFPAFLASMLQSFDSPCQVPTSLSPMGAFCQLPYHQVPFICDPGGILSRTEAELIGRFLARWFALDLFGWIWPFGIFVPSSPNTHTQIDGFGHWQI